MSRVTASAVAPAFSVEGGGETRLGVARDGGPQSQQQRSSGRSRRRSRRTGTLLHSLRGSQARDVHFPFKSRSTHVVVVVVVMNLQHTVQPLAVRGAFEEQLRVNERRGSNVMCAVGVMNETTCVRAYSPDARRFNSCDKGAKVS